MDTTQRLDKHPMGVDGQILHMPDGDGPTVKKPAWCGPPSGPTQRTWEGGVVYLIDPRLGSRVS